MMTSTMSNGSDTLAGYLAQCVDNAMETSEVIEFEDFVENMPFQEYSTEDALNLLAYIAYTHQISIEALVGAQELELTLKDGPGFES